MATMKVLISGSSGLIGSALIPYLTARGHQVVRLVRREPRQGEYYWDPGHGQIELPSDSQFDAAVHLSGATTATLRWTARRKALIRDSRVKSTELLVSRLTQLAHPPQVLVCASGVTYYGDRGDEVVDEDDPPGENFLAQVAKEWEASARGAEAVGIRVVHTRSAPVLTTKGSLLARLLLPFKLGLGATLGSGDQYMSWTAIDDSIAAIYHILISEQLSGPVNVASPNPVTNAEFTRTLGKVLRRPTLFRLPAFALRMVFGELADELLLISVRAACHKLVASGFAFQYPELEGALRHVLERQ
jgi:uncharacterized protein (TIGR01777 family)